MITVALAAIVLAPQQKVPPYVQEYKPKGPVIVATMESGKTFEITTDPKSSPQTVDHILNLVKKKFYDRQRVHRVEWWVTQWGAPASKDKPMRVKDKTGKLVVNDAVGDGGSGKDIPVFEGAREVDFLRGVVGIASTGLQVPGDSQLFILKANTMRLYNSYAVLGKVTKGMDAVDKIKFGDRIKSMKVRR